MEVISSEEAGKILSDMYIRAMDTYGFKFDTESEDNSKEVTLIGYDEVLNNYFTAEGKRQFEEFYKEVLKKDKDKVYLIDNSLIKNELNYELEISNKDIKSEVISAKVKINLNGTETENTFIIKKVDNMWKIDNFICPF